MERSTAVGGARSVEKNVNGERPTGYWWYKKVSVPVRQSFSKRMRHRKVWWKFAQCAQAVGEPAEKMKSPILSVVTGFGERSRKGIMEGLGKLSTSNNHCALDVGLLRYEGRSAKREAPRCESGKVPRS